MPPAEKRSKRGLLRARRSVQELKLRNHRASLYPVKAIRSFRLNCTSSLYLRILISSPNLIHPMILHFPRSCPELERSQCQTKSNTIGAAFLV